MDETLAAIDAYIAGQIPRLLDELERLIALPSVSTEGGAMASAATLVAEMLAEAGLETHILPTDGFPVVFGASRALETPGARTVICYNHYDVQPADSLDQWESPPFTLTQRGGRLYGRGVADDKGQLLSRIAAIRAVKAVLGRLPARMKFLVEGEEETGSGNLPAFIAGNTELLAADVCVWEIGGLDCAGRLALLLGMRGICSVELRVRTLARDAHSGGAHNLPNAAWRLIWALASIKDNAERIRIRGFYDGVRAPSASDLELLRQLPSDEPYTRAAYDVREFVGRRRGDNYKTAVFEPTANVAGLYTGWRGRGAKTIIPAEASAQMDFRLVPDQEPEDIFRKLRRHLDAEGFADVELRYLGGERAAATPADDPYIQLAARIGEAVSGQPVSLVPMSGGSGPMSLFRAHLGTPIVTLGSADPLVNIHAPNESLALASFITDIRLMARFLLAVATQEEAV